MAYRIIYEGPNVGLYSSHEFTRFIYHYRKFGHPVNIRLSEWGDGDTHVYIFHLQNKGVTIAYKTTHPTEGHGIATVSAFQDEKGIRNIEKIIKKEEERRRNFEAAQTLEELSHHTRL